MPYKVVPSWDGSTPVFRVQYWTELNSRGRWMPSRDLKGFWTTRQTAQVVADKCNKGEQTPNDRRQP